MNFPEQSLIERERAVARREEAVAKREAAVAEREAKLNEALLRAAQSTQAVRSDNSVIAPNAPVSPSEPTNSGATTPSDSSNSSTSPSVAIPALFPMQNNGVDSATSSSKSRDPSRGRTPPPPTSSTTATVGRSVQRCETPEFLARLISIKKEVKVEEGEEAPHAEGGEEINVNNGEDRRSPSVLSVNVMEVPDASREEPVEERERSVDMAQSNSKRKQGNSTSRHPRSTKRTRRSSKRKSSKRDGSRASTTSEESEAGGSRDDSIKAFGGAGFTCDMCEFWLTKHSGRFQCSICVDFDLCGDCHKQNLHPDHVLEKIEPLTSRISSNN